MASLGRFTIDREGDGFGTRHASLTKDNISVVPEVMKVCPRTALVRIADIASMKEFHWLCSTERLTGLPKNRRLFYPALEVSTTLSFMAQHPRESSCSCPRELKVADFPLKTTALVSYPGSGNTWFRHLIQQLTGLHTGSVYKHSFIKDNGFPFEGVTANMSVVKSHRSPSWNGDYQYDNDVVTFDRLLILLRNPYSSVMAEYKRGSLQLGKVKNGLINDTGTKWTSYVKKSSKLWYRFIREAFATRLPSLVIFYEDLTSCLLPELVKTAIFLHDKKSLDEFSFCCTLKNNEGSFHRPPSNQTIHDVYSKEHREVMNQILLKGADLVTEAHPNEAERILEYMLP